jgi:hypothetical protein
MTSASKYVLKMPGLIQVVPVLAVLMETLWAYTWLLWLSQWSSLNWTNAPLNFISCAILSVASSLLSGAAINRDWSIKRVRWVVLPSVLLVLLFALRLNNGGGYSLWDVSWLAYASEHLPALVIAFVFGIYLIWRGITTSLQSLNFSDLYRKFITGVIGIILLLLIWGLAKSQMVGSWSLIGLYITLFFGLGLLSLALVNLESLRTELLKHQEASSAFTRRWISILLLLVVGILTIALVVSGIFSSNVVGTVLHGLGIFANWLLFVIGYLLYPVGLLAAVLYYVLRWIVNLLRGGTAPPPFNLPDYSDLQKQAEGQSTVHVPLAILLVLKWGLLILLAAFLIFLLTRALARYWQGKDPENLDEEHESFFSWGLLRRDLGGFWSWLISRLKRKSKRKAILPGPVIAGEFDEGSDKEYNVRELFRAMLKRGRQIGLPKKPFQTPYEYEKQLESFYPESEQELKPFTQAYVEERYGEGVGPDKITFLNRLWRSLRNKLIKKDSPPG